MFKDLFQQMLIKMHTRILIRVNISSITIKSISITRHGDFIYRI